MRSMCKKPWPYIHIKLEGGVYVARSRCCNVTGRGSTLRQAYNDWVSWYTLPI